ncbi:cytochrome b561 domain-containing protein 2-like [Tropilaelaps mercedesae]|uniref:ascorbate ferrireductase (transmembrane) n=1 Tax=Tropilaelaps mercedesae TaxID=418985 RepID=A0A1V9XIL1_9ACAR|nr:cytochrome b561 domain-containing protein 2-like [Tropilaelaps mercedesae]
MACIGGGMFVVYEHKESLGKPHFTSLHSRFGLTANLGLICVALGGLLTLYRKSLGLPVIIKHSHMIAGAVVYLAAIGALITGLSSDWFSAVIMQSAAFYWRAIYVLPVLTSFVITMQVTKKFVDISNKGKDKKTKDGKDKKNQD